MNDLQTLQTSSTHINGMHSLLYAFMHSHLSPVVITGTSDHREAKQVTEATRGKVIEQQKEAFARRPATAARSRGAEGGGGESAWLLGWKVPWAIAS